MPANAMPPAQRSGAQGVKHGDVAHDDLEWLYRLRLNGGVTWVARDANGATLIVKRVDVPSEEACGRVLRALRAAQRIDNPAITRVLGLRAEGKRIWISREYDDGVPFARLLAITSPAPSQVVAIGEGLFAALEVLHGAGLAHGAVNGGNVLLGRDGRLRLADAGIAPALAGQTRRQAQQDDVAAGAGLVRALLKPGRSGSVPAVTELIRSPALGEAATAGEALGLLRAARGTQPSAEAERASLASLVSRLDSRNAGPPEHPAATATVGDGQRSVDGARAALAAALKRHDSIRRRRRLLVAALVLALVAAAAATAVLLVVRRPAATRPAAPAARQTRAAPARAASTPRSQPPPQATAGAHLSPPAPAAAGFIASAAVSTAAPCSLGRSCTLLSRLNLSAHDGEAVSWQVVAVDACTGARTTLYGSSIQLSPSYLYVYDQRSVTLPAGHPLQLYTLSVTPVRVASPPLLVPANAVSCGPG
jgi:serine/threonine protein kinase